MIEAAEARHAARCSVTTIRATGRRGSDGRRGDRASRVPVVDLVPLFLVLVTFAAALAGLQRHQPNPKAELAVPVEVRIERAEGDLDEASAALGRFARTSGWAGRGGETLLLDIAPGLIFETGAVTVRREALVLLYRLAQTLRDASGDLRLTVLVPPDDRAAPARLSAVVDELRRLGVAEERLAAGVRVAQSGSGLQLRLDGDFAP